MKLEARLELAYALTFTKRRAKRVRVARILILPNPLPVARGSCSTLL